MFLAAETGQYNVVTTLDYVWANNWYSITLNFQDKKHKWNKTGTSMTYLYDFTFKNYPCFPISPPMS